MPAVAVAALFVLITGFAYVHSRANAEMPKVNEAHRKFDYRLILRSIREQMDANPDMNAGNTVVLHFSQCSLASLVFYACGDLENFGVTFFPEVERCELTDKDNKDIPKIKKALEVHSVPYQKAVQGKRYAWLLVARWEKSKYMVDPRRIVPQTNIRLFAPSPASVAAVAHLKARRWTVLKQKDVADGEPKKFFDFMELYLFEVPKAAGR